MSALLIKICGVTTVEDALLCAREGADAVGLNLWPGSPRFVDPERARALGRQLAREHPHVLRVGVFVDPSIDDVRQALDEDIISAAQLHGDEPALPFGALGLPLWKALRIASADDVKKISQYVGTGWRRLVIDAPSAGYGGSGLRIDTALARLAAAHRIILAGGLTPDNLREAIRAVRPDGVDVASGVEFSPGRKDPARVRAFIQAARAAHKELEDEHG